MTGRRFVVVVVVFVIVIVTVRLIDVTAVVHIVERRNNAH